MKIPVTYWLKQLKRRGIENFEFKDLPQDLKNRSVMLRAKNRGYIERIRKGSANVGVWTIVRIPISREEWQSKWGSKC